MNDTNRARRGLAASRPFALAGALAVLLAACGSSGGSTTAPTSATSTTGPVASSAASAGASGAAEAYEVDVAQSPTLGAYITGEDGKTLYFLTKDAANKSNCSGQCATNWPPFTLETGESVEAGSGVSGTFATITRDDGTMQVTLNGMPLYYFQGDKAAGDTTGQGVQGVWFAVSPEGAAIGASPSASGGKGSY